MSGGHWVGSHYATLSPGNCTYRGDHTGLRQADIMLPIGIFFAQGLDNGLQVPLVGEEVGIGGIYEEGLHVVLPDVVGIRLLDGKKVVVRDIELVGAVALANVL